MTPQTMNRPWTTWRT